MPYITAQRYNSRPLWSRDANKSPKKICPSNTTEEMNRPWFYDPTRDYFPQNSLYTSSTPYQNYLQGRSVSYQNGSNRNRAFNGEGGRAPTAGYGGYGGGLQSAEFQNAFYGAANQSQFSSETGYGQFSSGRQPQWREQPATYQQTEIAPPTWHPAAYYSALQTTAPQQGQEYYAQGPQQYASHFFPYEPYLQYPQYGYIATPFWLTQQWQPVDDVPPPPPPPAPPSDLPYAQSYDVSSSSFARQKPSKNGHALLNQDHREALYSGETTPPPPPPPPPKYDTQIHSAAPWRGSVDVRSATMPNQKQDLKTSSHGYNLRNRSSGRNAQSTPSPILTKSNVPRPRAGSDAQLNVLERPVPTEKYLQQANQEPFTMTTPRPLLVVVDMNGTLVHRTDKRRNLNFIGRPRVNEFLHYLFTNHHVMIWSSSQPRTVAEYRKKLLFKHQDEQLIACWARDKLRIPEYAYHKKVQVYKQLSWIWKDEKIRSANIDPVDIWNQENTVLIDDSLSKAASEPYNIVQLEEFEGKQDQMQTDVLGQVVEYLETLRSERDVSAFMRRKPFGFDPMKSFDWTPIINDMH